MTDSTDTYDDPPSPCIGVCMINPETELCEGCFRNAEEVESWWDYEPTGKRQVLERCQERCQKLMDGTFFD